MLHYFLDVVLVPFLGVPGNQLADESCKEKHDSHQDGQQGEIEQRLVGYGPVPEPICLVYKLGDDDPDSHYETDKEHYQAREAEEVHRLLPESAEEPQGQEIQETVHESLDPELALPILPFLVMDWLLGYLVEAGILGKIGDVPVHLSVDLDILHDLIPVGLEATVHVMKLDTGDPSCSGIVKF